MTDVVPGRPEESVRIVRAASFHTPRDPFREAAALEAVEDAGLAFAGEEIAAFGPYEEVRRRFPDASVTDCRGGVLLPGLVDTHVHLPQIPVIGAMGLRLLDWLRERTLPEEARFADDAYARAASRTFLRALWRNGTTTALVFGAHFEGAMHAFFEEADALGARVASGLVHGDRLLGGPLHTTPERAYEEGRALAGRWHGHGRLRYAVTPRFSLSCSDDLLAACGALLRDTPGALFTSHLNEQAEEIDTVRSLFPDARDYLETYERHGLVGRRSVLAHDVHPTDGELERLARAGATACHCPSSNFFIGSGLFPFRRHLAAGVRVSLGSDVGGGTGFSLLKEGLNAYQCQMLLGGDGVPLAPAHLLYLATRAGAEALELEREIGDFTPGKSADYVLLEPPAGSTLAETLSHSPSAEATLGALFTLAREDAVLEVALGGRVVHRRGDADAAGVR